MKRAFPFILFVLTGCAPAPNNPAIITQFGTYSVSSNLTLQVSNNSGLLDYKLQRGDQPLLQSTERASIHQKWMLHFDAKQRLWVISSDVGAFLWVPTTNGYIQKQDLKNEAELHEMPDELKSKISSAHRRALGI